MKQKIIKKFTYILIPKLNKKSLIFKFVKLALKPRIKGNYCNKVYKKGVQLLPKVLINYDKKSKSKIAKKVCSTKLNQSYIMYNYKVNKLQTQNIKFKNVFYLVKEKNKILNFCYLIILGLVIGFINGFWGGGGGMVCVPTLTLLLGLPDKKAHATAILIMLPLSITSFVVYTIKGSIDYMLAGVIAGGFVVGGVVGALLLKKANNIVLQLIFAIIIIAGAIKILV